MIPLHPGRTSLASEIACCLTNRNPLSASTLVQNLNSSWSGVAPNKWLNISVPFALRYDHLSKFWPHVSVVQVFQKDTLKGAHSARKHESFALSLSLLLLAGMWLIAGAPAA